MPRNRFLPPAGPLGVVVICALLVACGEGGAPEKPKATGNHVWRGQTDAYYQAKDVAKGASAQLEAQEAAIERARRGD